MNRPASLLKLISEADVRGSRRDLSTGFDVSLDASVSRIVASCFGAGSRP